MLVYIYIFIYLYLYIYIYNKGKIISRKAPKKSDPGIMRGNSSSVQESCLTTAGLNSGYKVPLCEEVFLQTASEPKVYLQDTMTTVRRLAFENVTPPAKRGFQDTHLRTVRHCFKGF